jgi:hypothetical protein
VDCLARTRLARWLVLILTVGLIPLGPAQATHQPCDGSFHVEHHLPEGDGLHDVEMHGPEGWAVGTRGQEDVDQPLIVRFDNDSYEAEVLEEMAEGAQFLDLRAVSVIDSTNIFAAGLIQRRGLRGLLLRWDGSTWTKMGIPFPKRKTSLRGIEAITPGDVWAVGNWQVGKHRNETFIVHFDGSNWTHVLAPSPGRQSTLWDVSAVSPSDVWAVGTRGFDHGLILHWDGSTWSKVPLPEEVRGPNVAMDAVHALPNGELWIAGRHTSDRKNLALTLRWDGSSWSTPQPPNARGAEWLFDIDGTTDNMWATGYRFVPDNAYPYAARWNGSDWTRVATERPRDYGYYEGIAAGETGDAWAVGFTIYDQGALIALAC